MNGKKMRYEWNKINRDLHFIGDKKDVYGYSYFGDTNIKTEGLIEIAEQITNNEVVVLWTGRNDGSIPAQKTLENIDRKSTRLNSSHVRISYAVFCLKKKKKTNKLKSIPIK